MRWIALLAVLAGIIWTINWSYHSLDNTLLITNFWEVEDTNKGWSLVNQKGEDLAIYKFSGEQGFWRIFKELWPVWTLFILCLCVLLPLSRYIYLGRHHAQIIKAKDSQRKAEEQAKKAYADANNAQIKSQPWAEKKVQHAYQEQLTLVRKELENEWDEYHRLKNNIIERESKIISREQSAQAKEDSAKQKVEEIHKRYQIEKAQFEQRLKESTKTKKNAQSGQKRLRKEKEMIRDFLEHQRWIVEEEPMTYENLKNLAKAKQP